MRKIDDQFIIDYQITGVTQLGKRSMGGTDELFAWKTAHAFYDIMETVSPFSILEIGFNAGHSALMFLMISPAVLYHSVDLVDNPTSITFLKQKYEGFNIFILDSKSIKMPVREFGFLSTYDMIFLDGDHSPAGVRNDIEKSFLFNPDYILFDDFLHPGHPELEGIVRNEYKDQLEVVKVYMFNEIWKGYSMALCKVKY